MHKSCHTETQCFARARDCSCEYCLYSQIICTSLHMLGVYLSVHNSDQLPCAGSSPLQRGKRTAISPKQHGRSQGPQGSRACALQTRATRRPRQPSERAWRAPPGAQNQGRPGLSAVLRCGCQFSRGFSIRGRRLQHVALGGARNRMRREERNEGAGERRGASCDRAVLRHVELWEDCPWER